MIANWYYAHDDKRLGPFSQTQLKELAAAGTILPNDTVWLEGNEKGALASRVRYLFPPAIADALRAARVASVSPADAESISSADPAVATRAEIPAAGVVADKPAPSMRRRPRRTRKNDRKTKGVRWLWRGRTS